MTLATWLAASGITDAEFARQIGVTRQALSRYKAHSRFPRPDVLKRIHHVTTGSVTPNDFAATMLEAEVAA